MNEFDIDVSKAFIETIVDQLKVQPRANIVQRYYLRDQQEEEIAYDLGLTVEKVQYHLKIFRLMIIKSLRQLKNTETYGNISC